jgi:hypothetical protein
MLFKWKNNAILMLFDLKRYTALSKYFNIGSFFQLPTALPGKSIIKHVVEPLHAGYASLFYPKAAQSIQLLYEMQYLPEFANQKSQIHQALEWIKKKPDFYLNENLAYRYQRKYPNHYPLFEDKHKYLFLLYNIARLCTVVSAIVFVCSFNSTFCIMGAVSAAVILGVLWCVKQDHNSSRLSLQMMPFYCEKEVKINESPLSNYPPLGSAWNPGRNSSVDMAEAEAEVEPTINGPRVASAEIFYEVIDDEADIGSNAELGITVPHLSLSGEQSVVATPSSESISQSPLSDSPSLESIVLPPEVGAPESIDLSEAEKQAYGTLFDKMTALTNREAFIPFFYEHQSELSKENLIEFLKLHDTPSHISSDINPYIVSFCELLLNIQEVKSFQKFSTPFYSVTSISRFLKVLSVLNKFNALHDQDIANHDIDISDFGEDVHFVLEYCLDFMLVLFRESKKEYLLNFKDMYDKFLDCIVDLDLEPNPSKKRLSFEMLTQTSAQFRVFNRTRKRSSQEYFIVPYMRTLISLDKNPIDDNLNHLDSSFEDILNFIRSEETSSTEETLRSNNDIAQNVKYMKIKTIKKLQLIIELKKKKNKIIQDESTIILKALSLNDIQEMLKDIEESKSISAQDVLPVFLDYLKDSPSSALWVIDWINQKLQAIKQQQDKIYEETLNLVDSFFSQLKERDFSRVKKDPKVSELICQTMTSLVEQAEEKDLFSQNIFEQKNVLAIYHLSLAIYASFFLFEETSQSTLPQPSWQGKVAAFIKNKPNGKITSNACIDKLQQANKEHWLGEFLQDKASIFNSLARQWNDYSNL